VTRRLVLCSTSRYRRDLLARLQLPFESAAPDLDESPLAGETVAALTERLALAKAQALAAGFPNAVLIGSDQAASCDGRLLGKPGTRELAIEQLRSASGHEVEFHTEIERYTDREAALDCAGSFKCEGLGIALFDAIETRDPTALVGLPLIATARLLRCFGLDPLA